MFESIPSFLSSIEEGLKKRNIDVEHYEMDHLCWRVETHKEYELYKILLQERSELLIESKIGGRMIATYKLFNPIHYAGRVIDVIELPSPKKGSYYPTGWEHVEFVVKDLLLENMMKKYRTLSWKTSGLNDYRNPTVAIALDDGLSVKFHTKTLQNVIEEEQNMTI